MPWNNQDDQNWSIYETDSMRRLNEAGATPQGRDMFHDLLRGGRARVRTQGFDNNDLQRARHLTDDFIDYASREANRDQIDVQHLGAAMNRFCPFFPL
jgi:hypothetical protein